MRPGRAADHSPPSSAAVMEEYSYNSTHPLGHTGPVTGSLYLYQPLGALRDRIALNIQHLSMRNLKGQSGRSMTAMSVMSLSMVQFSFLLSQKPSRS